MIQQVQRIGGLAACTIAIVLALGPAHATEAEVYKWTDENGVVHYSDVPIDSRAQGTGIRSERTDARRVREEQLREWEQARRDEQEEQEQASDRQVAAERRAQDEAVQEDKCSRARERAARYETSHRLYEPMPDGGRRYLTDEELSAARQAAELEVVEWCD